MNERLIEYIKKHLGAGRHRDAIKQALLNAGYEIEEVEEHIRHVLRGSHTKKYLLISSIIIIVIIISISGFYYISKKPEKQIIDELFVEDTQGKESLELLNKGSISNDEAFCDNIEDDNLKDKCKRKFLSNGSIYDEQCQNSNILESAIIKNNESLCSKITEERLKKDCFNIFNKTSVFNETEKVCDEICMDKELLNKALISHNISLCIEIKDNKMKIECEQILER